MPANPQRIVRDSLMAPINGLYGIESAEDGTISVYNIGELFGAIDVALFILVIGGFIGVTMKTGAIQGGIALIVEKLRGRERWMIPVLMTVFAIGGTTFGMAEESLAFYALVITVMIAAGYDTLTGASILLLGCGIGVLGSTINPFATGIASGFAGTSIDEGLVLRLVILILGTIIGIVYVLRYADRIRADPTKSLVYAQKAENDAAFAAAGMATGDVALNGRQKAALGLFFLAFAVMIYGVVPWSDIGLPLPTLFWWFPEMTASFLLFSILIWLVEPDERDDVHRNLRRRRARPARGRADHRDCARHHGDHEQRVHHGHRAQLGRAGGGRPGRRGVHRADVRCVHPLSFLIPSSSGLATVAMPIMAPLASFADVPPQLVVTAYQTANGLVNLVTPTSAVVMGGLAIARVGYGTWLKFVWPAACWSSPILWPSAVVAPRVESLDVIARPAHRRRGRGSIDGAQRAAAAGPACPARRPARAWHAHDAATRRSRPGRRRGRRA